MKTGVSIGPLIEQAEDMPEAFDFIEFGAGEGEIDPEEIDFGTLRETIKKKKFNVIFHLPFRQPLATEVEEFNDAAVEYLQKLLGIVQNEIEIEKAVIHANMRDPGSEEQLENLSSQVRSMEEIGKDQGVEICFENVFHVDTPDMWTLAEILREEKASMCFDVGHAFMEADEEEVLEFLDQNMDLISHLHVHDIRERGDSHLCLGDGEIDFEKLGEKFQEFEGTGCLEIFTGDTELLDLSREKFLRYF